MEQTVEYASNAPAPLSDKYPRLAPHHVLPSKAPDYLRLILTAKVYDLIKETPLVLAPNLTAKLGNEIWLKREDLQEVFSFKIRGAYNFMAHLPVAERWRGVITCSAGPGFLFYGCDLVVSLTFDRKSCSGRGLVWDASQDPLHDRHAQSDSIHQGPCSRTLRGQGCPSRG